MCVCVCVFNNDAGSPIEYTDISDTTKLKLIK